MITPVAQVGTPCAKKAEGHALRLHESNLLEFKLLAAAISFTGTDQSSPGEDQCGLPRMESERRCRKRPDFPQPGQRRLP